MKVNIHIQGTAPLLMHDIKLADPLNPIVRQMKLISGKRKKTDDDLFELARLEFIGGLYIAEPIGPYVKGVAVEKSFVEGARVSKQGKQIERGLFIEETEIPLLYHGPRSADELWKDENFHDRQAVRVGQSRVHRMRPIFRSWSFETVAELDPALLNLDGLQAIITDAGAMVGLGDYRPRYGRYVGTVKKA